MDYGRIYTKVVVHRPGRTNAARQPQRQIALCLPLGIHGTSRLCTQSRREHGGLPCHTPMQFSTCYVWRTGIPLHLGTTIFFAYVIIDEHWVKTQTYMDGLIPRITIQGASHIAKFVYKLGSMFDDIYIYTFNYILCRWCFDPTDIHEHKLRVPSCSPQGLKLGGSGLSH